MKEGLTTVLHIFVPQFVLKPSNQIAQFAVNIHIFHTHLLGVQVFSVSYSLEPWYKSTAPLC